LTNGIAPEAEETVGHRMRLADFIVSNIEPILMEWEVFARGIAPCAGMDALALRDHAQDILLATVQDMKSSQSATERSAKSRGHHGHRGGVTGDGAALSGMGLNGASELHAVGRLGSGFDLMEVVSEYRALRASVLQLWRDSEPEPHERDVDDLTRFNESIDQSVAKAVSSYTKRVDQARDMYLAILSHDLRNPLNSIAMSAEVLRHADLDQRAAEALGCASQISTNAQVMARMIGDLLDYTRTRLGAGMPVSPARMDLAVLCRELFDEYRTAHPNRVIRFQSDGEQIDEWDVDRLRQAISNLLGNAVQHGDETASINLKVTGDTSEVVVLVHNGGPPIPPGELPRIFEPLVRGAGAEHPRRNRPGSIGLGLYIAREVARSHGGRIDVTSSQEAGTAFIMHLPRHSLVKSGQPILDDKHVQTM
jgi:signal transduction histidine kinase